MIKINDTTFFLNTENTSYIIHVNKHKLPISIYYGNKVNVTDDITPLLCRNTLVDSNLNCHTESNENFYLEFNPLEYSIKNYDGRTPSFKLDTFSFNFKYFNSVVLKEKKVLNTSLPSFKYNSENCETLVITLVDTKLDLFVNLIYTVFEKEDVITKQTVIRNNSNITYSLRDTATGQLNLINDRDYKVYSYSKNFNENVCSLTENTTTYSSSYGSNKNKNLPFLLLEDNENNMYSLSYMYSSNFYINTEITASNIIHVNMGLKDFTTRIESMNELVLPVMVLSYSDKGKDKIRENLTLFTTNYIVGETWRKRAKPLVFHSFNSLHYRYSEIDAKKIVKDASNLGFELFVLDDGWFSLREDKTRSLGDWFVDTKKFSEGLEVFSSYVHDKGLLFGLYLSPEVVSKYSLYYNENKTHVLQDYNIDESDFPTSYNLDLNKTLVQNNLIERITSLIKLVNLDYINLDVNKFLPNHLNNNSYHNYILGLYKVLKEIKERFPKLLIETNDLRVDYGMLCYCDQIRINNTEDPYENLKSLENAATFFELTNIVNTMGNKSDLVSLRSMSLENKFNLSCFGTLSYNMDVNQLTKVNFQQIEKQVQLYKMKRSLFQFGRFKVVKSLKNNKNCIYQIMDKSLSNGFVLYFTKETTTSPYFEKLRVKELDINNTYIIVAREQKFRFKVIKRALEEFDTIKFTEEIVLSSTLDNNQLIDSDIEAYKIKGDLLLNCGIILNNKYRGTGLDPSTRIVTDFSSRLYEIKKV